MVIELNKDNFQSEVKESDIPVIVDFWASWCGPCVRMKPLFEELSGNYEGKCKFGKVDSEHNPELSQENSITSIPCFVVFNKGEEVERIVGAMSQQAFAGKLDAILEGLK